MTPYASGYYAALWGFPLWCNPWPILMTPERLAWADGHTDALADAHPKRAPRLQAEFEVR